MSNTEKFDEFVKGIEYYDTEEYCMAINDFAEKHPECAPNAIKEFEANAQYIAQNDDKVFLKDEAESLKRYGKPGCISHNGFALEMLARFTGDFVYSFPEYSQNGLDIIKQLSSAKSHDEVSLAGSCEALGKILSVCPTEMDKDAIETWQNLVKIKGKEHLTNKYQYSFLLSAAIERAYTAKPYLASDLNDIIKKAKAKHDISEMSSISEVEERISENNKESSKIEEKISENNKESSKIEENVFRLGKVRKKMAKIVDTVSEITKTEKIVRKFTKGKKIEEVKMGEGIKKLEKGVDKLIDKMVSKKKIKE